MGHNKREINLMPWSRADSILQNEPNSMLFSISRTKDRKNPFKWVCPIATNKNVLMAKKDRSIQVKTPEDARQYQIGTISGDIAGQMLCQANFDKKQFMVFPA